MAEGRHFFALWPSQEVRQRLAREASQVAARGRLHHPEDLHMTLVFLGPVAEARLRCVEEVADGILNRPFDLCIDAIGYWPRPRILWAGPREIPEPLRQLVFDLQNGLTACGFEPERRRYKPHVTLYRKAANAHPAVIEPAIEWPVGEFVLAVSGGGAPRYRVVKRWSL
ncbi:MAG: RNA 2',3'-cyclic phosphodiesterase [Candidatus Thiodiazotropha sp.]